LYKRATTSERERSRVFILPSYLCTKFLQEGNRAGPSGSTRSPCEWSHEQFLAACKGVQKWSRGQDMFNMDAILTPIFLAIHWSLFVIINPSSLHDYLTSVDKEMRKITSSQAMLTGGGGTGTMPARLASAIRAVPLPRQKTALVRADSLGDYHKPDDFAMLFGRWLLGEWRAKKNGGEPIGGTEEAEQVLLTLTLVQEGGQQELLLHALMPRVKLSVPQQPNNFDCGLYALRNAEALLQMMRGPWASKPPWGNPGAELPWPALVPTYDANDITATRSFMLSLFRGLLASPDDCTTLSAPFSEIADQGVTIVSTAWTRVLQVEPLGQQSSAPGFMVRRALELDRLAPAGAAALAEVQRHQQVRWSSSSSSSAAAPAGEMQVL